MELGQDLKQQYHRTVKGESCDSAVGCNVRGIRTGAGGKEERSFIAPGCWSFRVIAELTRSRLITIYSREFRAVFYPARSLILLRGSEEGVLILGRSEPSSVAAHRIKPRRR